MDDDRGLVAAILTNGLLGAVQPGADARLAARRVVTIYQAVLSEMARSNLPLAADEPAEMRRLEVVGR